jgi:hypothetical protein
MVAHICNPSTGEQRKEESQILSQPGLHSESLSQKTIKKKIHIAVSTKSIASDKQLVNICIDLNYGNGNL